MGLTPDYGYPYPEPTDRVRSGSVAIRLLAEHAEAREALIRDAIAASYYQTGNAGALAAVADGVTAGVALDPGAGTPDWGMVGASLTYLAGPFRLVIAMARVEVAAVPNPATERASLLRLKVNASEAGQDRQYFHPFGGGTIAEVRTHHVTAMVGMNAGDTLSLELVNQSGSEDVQINGPRQLTAIGISI